MTVTITTNRKEDDVKPAVAKRRGSSLHKAKFQRLIGATVHCQMPPEELRYRKLRPERVNELVINIGINSNNEQGEHSCRSSTTSDNEILPMEEGGCSDNNCLRRHHDNTPATVTAKVPLVSCLKKKKTECTENADNATVVSATTDGAVPRQDAKHPHHSKTRSVHFDSSENMFLNKYRENGRDIYSEEEWRRCWYTTYDLHLFRQNQANVIRRYFSKQPTEWEPSTAPAAAVVSGKGTKKLSSLIGLGPKLTQQQHQREQQQQESATIAPQQQQQWIKTVSHTYHECRKVQHNNYNIPMGQVDRADLCAVYRRYSDLVGCEIYFLYGLRGSVQAHVRRVLSYYHDLQRNTTSSVLGRGASHGGGGGCGIYSEEDFVQACRSLTQPAAKFCHDTATAKAAALRLEEDDNSNAI